MSEWIPVGERLPENTDSVLVTARGYAGRIVVGESWYSHNSEEWLWGKHQGADVEHIGRAENGFGGTGK